MLCEYGPNGASLNMFNGFCHDTAKIQWYKKKIIKHLPQPHCLVQFQQFSPDSLL